METQHWKNKSNKIAHRRAFVCSDVSVEFPMNVRIWVLLNVMQSSNMYVFTTTILVYVQQVAVSSQRIVLQANWCTQNPEKLKKKDAKQAKWSELLIAPAPLFAYTATKMRFCIHSFVHSLKWKTPASTQWARSALMTVMSSSATNSTATTMTENKIPKVDYLLRNTGRAISFVQRFHAFRTLGRLWRRYDYPLCCKRSVYGR